MAKEPKGLTKKEEVLIDMFAAHAMSALIIKEQYKTGSTCGDIATEAYQIAKSMVMAKRDKMKGI